MYVKRSSRRTPLNIYRWRCRAICQHLLLNPISDVNFHQFWRVCKVPDFSRPVLGPLNAIKFGEEEERRRRRRRRNNKNKNGARFNRVLAPSVARSLIKLQAAMKDLGARLTADRWACRKDMERLIICILKGKYRGMCHSHLYVSTPSASWFGAMSITEH